MSSAVIGLLLLLLGEGGYALTRSPLASIPALTGSALIILGALLLKKDGLRVLLGTALAVSSVTMIFTASSMPRFARMLTGAEVERSGDIFVIGLTAVLCLLHVTLALRLLLRSRTTE